MKNLILVAAVVLVSSTSFAGEPASPRADALQKVRKAGLLAAMGGAWGSFIADAGLTQEVSAALARLDRPVMTADAADAIGAGARGSTKIGAVGLSLGSVGTQRDGAMTGIVLATSPPNAVLEEAWSVR